MRILNPKGSNKVLETPGSTAKLAADSGASAFSVETIEELELFEESSANKKAASKTKKKNKESFEDRQKKIYQGVFAKGVHLLSMREHSVREMEEKLSRKCDAPDVVSAVVDDLVENNYLSNSRFAETYVRSRRAKGFGPTKIRLELVSKGIDSSMAADYLEPESAIWFETAEHQYHKKYGDKVISDYNTWTKRARFLQSRGFTMDHIHSTLKRPESD